MKMKPMVEAGCLLLVYSETKRQRNQCLTHDVCWYLKVKRNENDINGLHLVLVVILKWQEKKTKAMVDTGCLLSFKIEKKRTRHQWLTQDVCLYFSVEWNENETNVWCNMFVAIMKWKEWKRNQWLTQDLCCHSKVKRNENETNGWHRMLVFVLSGKKRTRDRWLAQDICSWF